MAIDRHETVGSEGPTSRLSTVGCGENPAIAELAEEPFRVPRLSILHLLVWMVALAVVFAVDGHIARSAADVGISMVVVLAGFSFAMSGALAGSVILLPGIVQRKSIAHLAPGHMLVLATAVPAVVQRILSSLVPYGTPTFIPIFNLGSWLSLGVAMVLGMALWFWYALACHTHERVWRGFAYSMAAAQLLRTIASGAVYLSLTHPAASIERGVFVVTTMLSLVVMLMASILFATGVVRDWRNKRRRDWLHGAGMAIAITLVILSIAATML